MKRQPKPPTKKIYYMPPLVIPVEHFINNRVSVQRYCEAYPLPNVTLGSIPFVNVKISLHTPDKEVPME